MGIFDRFKDKKNTAKPDFSNVQSGSSTTAPRPAAQSPAPSSSPSAEASGQATLKTYTVVKGDSLSKIARRHYGDAQQWRKIYEANKDSIKDPDLIYPGQNLRIP